MKPSDDGFYDFVKSKELLFGINAPSEMSEKEIKRF